MKIRGWMTGVHCHLGGTPRGSGQGAARRGTEADPTHAAQCRRGDDEIRQVHEGTGEWKPARHLDWVRTTWLWQSWWMMRNDVNMGALYLSYFWMNLIYWLIMIDSYWLLTSLLYLNAQLKCSTGHAMNCERIVFLDSFPPRSGGVWRRNCVTLFAHCSWPGFFSPLGPRKLYQVLAEKTSWFVFAG